MISIKKYLDSNRDALLSSALESYRSALSAMASRGPQACPPVGSSLQQSLLNLQNRLSGNLTPVEVEETEAEVEKELEQWARLATDYYRQSTDELKELLLVMAGTAEGVGERDARYEARFRHLSQRLSDISDMHDLKQIRTALLSSAADLKTCVQQMAQEGKAAVSQLRAEVQKCQTRIEEVERIAVSDPLTGLANRRGTEAALEFRVARQRSFSVIMADLNGFKQINDVYGHQAGDQVLQQFAAELKGMFRATDCVGRWAGDEFVVVLDGLQADADSQAERLRKWVFGKYPVGAGPDPRKVNVEAALGVAEWRQGESIAALMERVDQLMYRQKKGR